MAKRKNLIKVLATLGVSALVAGAGVSTLSAGATAEKTVAGKGVDSFQMVYGASVRCGDGVENGIRFSATISDDEYKALEKLEETSGVSVNYGVLIVPADMFAEADLTEANIFQNANYCLENCESGCSKTHLATVEYATLADDSATDEVMNLRGSLIRIKEDNINREFVGLAYIEYEKENDPTQNEYEFANYALPVDENNNPIAEGVRELANTTRSMTYVAQRAIVKNEVDATTAQTLASDYIAPLANYDFKYYVNHHLDSDTVVTETLYGKLNSEVTAQHIAKTNPTEYSHYATYGASADSNTSDIVYANGRTVLNYYYAEQTLFSSADTADVANLVKANSLTEATMGKPDGSPSDMNDVVKFTANNNYGNFNLSFDESKIDSANSAHWDYLVVRMYATATMTNPTDAFNAITSIDMFSWNTKLDTIQLNTWVDMIISRKHLNNPNSQVINTKDGAVLSQTAFENEFKADYINTRATANKFFWTNTYGSISGATITYYIDKITYGVDVKAPEIDTENISKVYAEGTFTPDITVTDDIIKTTTYSTTTIAPAYSIELFSLDNQDVRTPVSAGNDGSYVLEKGNYVMLITANDGNATDVIGNVATKEVEFEVVDTYYVTSFDNATDINYALDKVTNDVDPTISYATEHGEGENKKEGILVYQSTTKPSNTYGGYLFLNFSDEMITAILNAYNDTSVDFTFTLSMWVEVQDLATGAWGYDTYGVDLYGKKYSYANTNDMYYAGQWQDFTFTRSEMQTVFGWEETASKTETTMFYKTLTGATQLFCLQSHTCGKDASITYYIDSISFSTNVIAE